MTENSLTIIMGTRNRDPERIKRCLISLARQTRDDFSVQLVDYGSRLSLARTVASLTQEFSFCRYTYSDTRGWPWCRSRALNIGVRLADTEYVLMTDVDIIFAPNLIDTVLKWQDGRSVVYCACRLLPESFVDWDHIDDYAQSFPKAEHGLGGCQCVPRLVMEAIQGFDETLEYWGAEDKDLHQRLIRYGLPDHWVEEETAVYHQWHPIERGGVPSRYRDSWLDPYLEKARDRLTRNTADWGRIVYSKQRPLFKGFPGLETEHAMDWTALLRAVAPAKGAQPGSPKWLITDCASGPALLAALGLGYQCKTISLSWVRSMFCHADAMEQQVQGEGASALVALARETHASPMVMVIDLATFARISRSLFVQLVETLASGGVLAIGNLHQTRVPEPMRYVVSVLSSMLKTYSSWFKPLSAKVCRLLGQASTTVKETVDSNELRDAVYFARVGVDHIEDFALDLPGCGGTAVFVKAQ